MNRLLAAGLTVGLGLTLAVSQFSSSPAPGATAPAAYDLDGDGVVSILDVGKVADWYGHPAAKATCYSLVRNIPPEYTPAPGHTPNPQDYFSFQGPAFGSDDAAFIGVPTASGDYPTLIAHGMSAIRFCPDSFDDWTPQTPSP